MTNWPKLKRPPVVVAICQLLFEETSVSLEDFLRFDTQLRKYFPNRNDNISANINIKRSKGTPFPLGKAPIDGYSEAKVTGYMYFSKNQKEKLDISVKGITYTTEADYLGWESFKANVIKYFDIFKETLIKTAITRTSIRFINQFGIKEFNDPSEYFNTVITTRDDGRLPYPLLQYGFRMTLDVKEGVYSIVNQSVERKLSRFVYMFDIDVLNKNNLLYTSEAIGDVLEDLRNIKNQIFFSNITDKTKELCN